MSGGVDPRLRNLQAALGHLADFPRFLSATLQPESHAASSQPGPALDLESIDVDDFPGTQEDLAQQQQMPSNQSSQGFGTQVTAGTAVSNTSNMPSRIPSLAELPLPVGSQTPTGDRQQQRQSYQSRRTLVEPTTSGVATTGGITPMQQAQPPAGGSEEFAQNPELRVKVGQVRSSSNLALNGARIAGNELKRSLDAISSTTFGVRSRIFESLIPELASQQSLLDQAAGSPSQRASIAAEGEGDNAEDITLESLLPPPASPELLVGLQLRQYRLNQSEACLHKIQDNHRLLQQLLTARAKNASAPQVEVETDEPRNAEADDTQEYFAGMKRVLEQQAQEARAKLELFLSAQANALAVQAEQFEQLRATVRSHQQHLVGQVERRQHRLLQLESDVYDEVRVNMQSLLSARARKLQEVRAQLAQVSRYDASAAGLMQNNRQLEAELTNDVEELNKFRRIYHEAHLLVTGKDAASEGAGDSEASVAGLLGSTEPTRLSGLFPQGMLRPSESRSQPPPSPPSGSDVDYGRFSYPNDMRASGRPSWHSGSTPFQMRAPDGGRTSQNLPMPMPELGNWGEDRDAYFQQIQFGASPTQGEAFGTRLSATRLPASTPVDSVIQRPSAAGGGNLPFSGSRDEIIEVVTEEAGTPRSGGDNPAAPTPPLPAQQQGGGASNPTNAAIRVNTVPHLSRPQEGATQSKPSSDGTPNPASGIGIETAVTPTPGAPGAHAIRHRLKVASTPQNQKLPGSSAPGSPVSTTNLYPQRELTEDDIGEEDGADRGEGFFNRIAALVGLSSGQKRRTAVKSSRAEAETETDIVEGNLRTADRRQRMNLSLATKASPQSASPQSSPARQKQRLE